MKRLFSVLAVSILALCSLAADKYRIIDVHYDIVGISKKYALEQAVDIDKDKKFESYDDLHNYIENLKQLFNNERNLEYAIVNCSYDLIPDPEGYTKVTLHIFTQDSKHLLVVPYPKYNSNDGFICKLKVKDTNFLGTLEPLDCDINFSIEPESDDSDSYDTIFGINFSYSYPFKMWKLDSKWNNDFSIDYTLGKSTPEFSYDTGFTFSLPFKTFSIQLDLKQSITKDFDYEEYDDELYFTEAAKLSVPIKAGEIEHFDEIKWTPYVSYDYKWDKNGINDLNEDLLSPILKIGHGVSTGRVNWYGNFREGLDLSMDQHIGYNYKTKEYLASINGTLKAFKAFKYAGLCARFIGFYNMNETNSIGSYLRGIRDDQKYDKYEWRDAGLKGDVKKALTTEAAIVGNIDMPFHVVTTDWVAVDSFIFGQDSWMTNHLRWMRYFDFELQFNPFVDFALCSNLITNKTFAIKDGWYAGGLEVLVYPAKWRSLVVRASAGIDAGRKIVNKVVSKLFDNSWRNQGSALEISIGIGLHY